VEGAPLGLLIVAAFLAFVALAHYGSYRQTGGRSHGPLWLAFGATAGAIFHIGAGLAGYNLGRHSRFVTGTAWSETVIWWEVGVGVVLAAIAAACWRTGIRSIRRA
jgi:hypothetical protein